MSYTLITNLANNIDTTSFRAWGSAISTALSGSGWTQTADSGQVNWTSVSAPANIGASFNYCGYEMWQMQDSIQSTTPALLKIRYGGRYWSSGGNYPAIQLQIGSFSDGSGNLIDQYQNSNLNAGDNNPVIEYASYGTSSSPYRCIFSGDTNRFGCSMWVNGSSIPMWFCIERLHNSSGVDLSDGFVLYGGGWFFNRANGADATAYIGTSQIVIPQYGTGAVPPVQNTIVSLLPSGFTALGSMVNTGNSYGTSHQTTGVFGNTIGTYPIFPVLGKAYNPCMGALFYFTSDLPSLTTISQNIYGSNHTYYVTGNGPTINQSAGVLLRYE